MNISYSSNQITTISSEKKGIKLIYSEKATKFYEISTVSSSEKGLTKSGGFEKIFGLLRIYEL